MKTITYRGKKYEVEDWVNFVAMDSDGSIYAHEHEPYRRCGEWVKTEGRIHCIGDEVVEWENSIEKV